MPACPRSPGKIAYVGPKPGLGQAVKHCNQLLVATTLAATAEVITLARKEELDLRLVCQVIGSGICGSDFFRLLASSILDHAPAPGDWARCVKTSDWSSMTAGRRGFPSSWPLQLISIFSRPFLGAGECGDPRFD